MTPPIKSKTENELEQLATSVVLINKDYKIKYINPSGEILFHSSHNQIKNKHIKEIFYDFDYLKDTCQKALEKKSTYKEHDFPCMIKDKEKRITFSVTPSEDTDYKFILEFTEMDQILKVAKEERMLIQQKANSELLRNLAHEIRNPLGGIKGAAQLLKQQIKGEYDDFINIIIGETQRLQDLMDGLMQPYKLPKFENTNIHEVIEKVQKSLSAEFQNVGFVRDYDISLPETKIDKDKIYQAIYNLIRNACQAFKKIDTQNIIKITTRAERKVIFHNKLHHTVIAISIEDNGPGINPEIQDKIFFPLVTNNKSDGVGIGLTIVQNFISLHNGMIDFESQPGKTIFKVLLPLDRDDDQ